MEFLYELPNAEIFKEKTRMGAMIHAELLNADSDRDRADKERKELLKSVDAGNLPAEEKENIKQILNRRGSFNRITGIRLSDVAKKIDLAAMIVEY